jgi:large subunit ribosomal protein L35
MRGVILIPHKKHWAGMPRSAKLLKQGTKMPKMKTKSAAKKRFKVTASGKVKSKAAFTRHMMRNKSTKMKRKARGMACLNESDAKVILTCFMPYSRRKARKPKARAAISAKVEA